MGKIENSSVSVISRAYDAEAPYIKSFIEHYNKMGCDEFHIVIPKGNPHKILDQLLINHPNVTVYSDEGVLKGSQNIPLKHIKTSHILSVDIDEYLEIDNIKTLLKYDYVRLNWIITPFPAIERTNRTDKIKGFTDRQCKYLVKTNICQSLDEHNCKINTKNKLLKTEYPLIHYVYRSFNDLYLKCSMSQYNDYQATTENQLIEGIVNPRKLPLKFKMAAIYQRIADASEEKQNCLYTIDLDLEAELILNTEHHNIIPDLKKALAHYSSRIDLNALIKKMLKNKNYKSYGRIPHHAMAKLSDDTLFTSLTPQNWIKSKKKKLFF